MLLISFPSSHPTWCSFFSVVATLLFSTSVEAATFRDDRGVVHSWDNAAKAKIGVGAATGGVSLFHMGLAVDQLVAIWGMWGIRGSTFDPENPTAGSNFPEVDPGPEEAAFFGSGD